MHNTLPKMKKFWKILSNLFIFTLAFWFVFAADPDAFFVEVSPDSFSVWESVDMTITAIKSDGTTVKDYVWDVFILVEPLNFQDYVAPSNWLYEFIASDQWEKLFSKWLKVNKAGTYKVNVSALLDPSIVWEATIIVWNSGSGNKWEGIDITYPIAWSTESKTALNVMWSSTTLKNSPVEVYLNKSLIANDYTDAQWNFNVYISWLRSGQNEIQVKIVDINNIVLWESDVIIVNYKAPSDGVFESIQVLPSSSIKQWEKVTTTITTSETVTSAELVFSNWDSYPLDRLSAWTFAKEFTAMTPWVFDLSLTLSVNWTTKSYKNIASINVEENIWVLNVKFAATWVDGTAVVVTWDQMWNAPKYNILYGTQKDNLQKNLVVSTTWVMVDNLQTNTKYYFQIVPMDELSHASWTPSDIFEYNPNSVSHECVIKWIKLKSEKIWDKYYLVRWNVENAVSYEIYRSDWADMSSMTKVWDTTGTRFEYYFNKDAESDQYAYYQVQAICANWSNVMIQNVEKVKVWPFENILLIIVISLFLYCIYRLYRTMEVNNE